MATPESNSVGRMEAFVANVLNREVSASDPDDLALLLRVADAAVSHGSWQGEFLAAVADPDSPTNQEKAEFVLLKTRHFWQTVLRSEGRNSAAATYVDAIAAAGEAAAADMA